jgi:phosphoribosylaminoimidazolecarboxamide formyltransferase/IMP cyclohydrolase
MFRGLIRGKMADRYALISTYDKTGLVRLAEALLRHNYKLIATDGTANYLARKGIKSTTVGNLTGFSTMLGGRVKTLHPVIFGGILAKGDEDEITRHNLPLVDIVVVNLYPFDKEPSIENIDIGGISLIRAAGKNHTRVSCVVYPKDYDTVIEELDEKGSISPDTRLYLARKAFSSSAYFDIKVSEWLGSDILYIPLQKIGRLRYGENPHQEAILLKETGSDYLSIINADKIQGKEPSYNNICDLDTVLSILVSFKEPASCIIKHSTPCGVAISMDIVDAYRKARSCDPLSSFGGIVGVNREVDRELASELTSTFLEAVLAPSYTNEAIDILSKKKRLILLQLPLDGCLFSWYYRYINGGFLKQDSDILPDNIEDFKVVTKRKPNEKEYRALCFAFKVVRFIRSNAVCITTESMTVGIGGGQPNRVGSLEIALKNKKNYGFKEGIVLASDGFFPFRDSIDLAAKEGIRAVIQPGGSIRDKEVISAADEHDIAMVFTGRRHFKH